MKSWALRVTAVLLAVFALAAGGYVALDSERDADAARAALRNLEVDVTRLQVILADLRAALPGYVAAGQDPSYWTRRVTTLVQDFETRLGQLERPGIGTATSQEIGTAEEASAALRLYDVRVRTLVGQDRRGEASRLVFSEADSLMTAASVALSQAVVLERTAADAAIAGARRRSTYALAAAAALALVAVLLLMPLPARGTASSGASAAEADAAEETAESLESKSLFGGPLALDALGRSGFDLDLDATSPAEPASPDPSLVQPVAEVSPPGEMLAVAAASPSTTSSPAPAIAPSPAAASAPVPVPSTAPARAASPSPRGPASTWPPFAPAAPPPDPTFFADLAEAARLCTDLARVADTDQLRQLLGRAAALLHARGIVVWLGGLNGESLRPAFSHGYSQQTLAHMQVIGRDEETAVSAAYRTGRLQAVAAGDHGAAALVAPLLAPAGCIGTMAVEVGGDAEQDAGLRALTELIAAQLATLMPTEG